MATHHLACITSLASIEKFLVDRYLGSSIATANCNEQVTIFLDLDGTVFESAIPSDCAVVASPANIHSFSNHIRQLYSFARPSFVKSALERFSYLLKTKRTIEKGTCALVQRLQGSTSSLLYPRVCVLGLTARWVEQAADARRTDIARHLHVFVF